MDELQEMSLVLLMMMQIIFLIFFTNNRIEEDDDDDEVNEAVMVYINARVHRDDPNRIKNYVMLTVMNNTEQRFQEDFQISTTAFNWLLRELSPFLSSPRISGCQTREKMEKLLAVLWFLAVPDSYRSVGEQFDISKSELFDAFLKIIHGLNAMAPQIITWPNEARRRITEQQLVKKAGIPGVVGAIDGTYVRISKPQQDPEAYNNRKCFYSFTLQGICDHELLFTDVFTRVVRDGYCTYLHAPVFSAKNEILRGSLHTGRQRRFNSRHAKTRVVIGNAWALLYGRFRRLRYLDMKRTDLIPATIVACCVLHNVCRRDPNVLAELYHEEGRQHLERLHNDDDDVANAVDFEMIRQQGVERRDRTADSLYQA